jgi:L,D-peptidoglycan transpeptidase YkuD (ErfK/YbiS/YcfS/YnhG family)
MIITLKNKDTLIVDEFRLKCCIGRGNLKKDKVEGDGSTPRGKFGIGTLYWRSDRVRKPNTKLFCKPINKRMAWCNDSKSKFYNKEIKVNKKIKFERIYRNDYKYNYLILLKYNYINPKKNKGSAIFIHLTKDYKKTAGCIALSKKDFLILAKLINKKLKIMIN